MGTWSVAWLTELDKYVKPEIAGQVKQLMELLIHVRGSLPRRHVTPRCSPRAHSSCCASSLVAGVRAGAEAQL